MHYDLKDIGPAPWHRYQWTGEIVAADDGCSTDDFDLDDVESVLAHYESDDWDQISMAIVQLTDGRYVAWETWSDATGNGFCHGAYGGTTDIIIGSSVESVLEHLGGDARERLIERIE